MAIEAATTSTENGTGPKQGLQFRGLFPSVIPCSVNFEEDSIADTSASAAVYTVTGAKVGDFVIVAPLSDLGDDLSFNATVTDANEVTVFVYNGAGAGNTSAATVGILYLLVLSIEAGMFKNAG